jgi:hypothetical protein
MAGFMSQALGALLKENAELVANAKILGGLVDGKFPRQEEVHDLATGERTFRWCIEFTADEDRRAFADAVTAIWDVVTEGGRE